MKSFKYLILIFSTILLNCSVLMAQDPYILVLGTAQDGGYPHLGCEKECCNTAWDNPEIRRFVVSLALVDPKSKSWYLFEATPDMSDQIQYFKELTEGKYNYLPDGIFVSHAHIGHYPGLMELGREAMSSKYVPVYALPRMAFFLENNGPWNQLISLNNIELKYLTANSSLELNNNISINIFEVPHRDEYSETAGYKITTSKSDYLFVPDIDKWSTWSLDIIEEIKSVDHAFIDGTFYSTKEIPGRSMEEIPHPFVSETMELFETESTDTKKKLHFIHLNHSNPLLYKPEILSRLNESGYSIAIQGEKY